MGWLTLVVAVLFSRDVQLRFGVQGRIFQTEDGEQTGRRRTREYVVYRDILMFQIMTFFIDHAKKDFSTWEL